MKNKYATCIAAAVLVLATQPASAQLFKCKGPDGKIVYSDSRCEASDAGALKVNPNSTTLSERERAAADEAARAKDEASRDKAEGEKLRRQLEAAGVRVGSPGAKSAAAPQGPYELTYGDRERIRSLEMTVASSGASNEARSAARAEIEAIRSGHDARLSSDQRSQRDSLRTDFSSTDAPKRRKALDDFNRLYR
jgi:hypothetical protein